MAEKLIVEMIKNPVGLKAESSELIAGLLEKYPYFSTAYFLMARVLKNTDSENFKSFLNIAASAVVNRKKLHDFLMSDYGNTDLFQDAYNKDQKLNEEENIREEATEEISDEAYSINELKVVEPENVQKEDIIDYNKHVKTKELKSHIAETVKRQLDQAEELDEKEFKIIPDEYNLNSPVSNINKDKEAEVNKKESIFIDDDLLEFELEILSKKEENKKTEQEFPKTDFTEEKKSLSGKDKNSLIDDFIKADPRIKVSQDEKFEYEDISQSSIQEDDSLLTDTLAKIYIKQGHFSKAIFTYEKLILKYPEKKAYFASQIEKIKEKIINNG